MLKDNLKALRKNKGLSQEELSAKLHVVRQTVSKWESGLSMPDAQMLMRISKIFETPVNEILEEKFDAKENNDLKTIQEKIDIINNQLSMYQQHERNRLIKCIIIVDFILIFLFLLLAILGSPYLSWNFNNPEWAVIGTSWHVFEWLYFKIAPFIIIIITLILMVMLIKKNKQ